MGAGASVC
ncbi:hypothetical protein SUNI508_14079, partial [Seiridium unicorne]